MTRRSQVVHSKFTSTFGMFACCQLHRPELLARQHFFSGGRGGVNNLLRSQVCFYFYLFTCALVPYGSLSVPLGTGGSPHKHSHQRTNVWLHAPKHAIFLRNISMYTIPFARIFSLCPHWPPASCEGEPPGVIPGVGDSGIVLPSRLDGLILPQVQYYYQ